MKLILCTGIISIDETNFSLNESWIVTGLIESVFHFNEVLLRVVILEYASRIGKEETGRNKRKE